MNSWRYLHELLGTTYHQTSYENWKGEFFSILLPANVFSITANIILEVFLLIVNRCEDVTPKIFIKKNFRIHAIVYPECHLPMLKIWAIMLLIFQNLTGFSLWMFWSSWTTASFFPR